MSADRGGEETNATADVPRSSSLEAPLPGSLGQGEPDAGIALPEPPDEGRDDRLTQHGLEGDRHLALTDHLVLSDDRDPGRHRVQTGAGVRQQLPTRRREHDPPPLPLDQRGADELGEGARAPG